MTLSCILWSSFLQNLDDPFTSWIRMVSYAVPYVSRPGPTTISGLVSPSSSFLLPRWGAIVILNPDESSPGTKLASTSLDTIFTTFSEHLLALLGVPKLPSSIANISNELSQWQLDALLRYRTLSNWQVSQDTLRSIVNLVDQIENMPVGQDVRDDVQGALLALEEVRVPGYIMNLSFTRIIRCLKHPKILWLTHSFSPFVRLPYRHEHFSIRVCWPCSTFLRNINMLYTRLSSRVPSSLSL